MNLHERRSSGEQPRDAQADELRALLEALCEQRLDRAGAARLERMVLADAGARKLYLDYIELHGSLYWDAATADEESLPVAEQAPPARGAARRDGVELAAIVATRPGRMVGKIAAAAVALAACALVLIGVAAYRLFDSPANDAPRIAETPGLPAETAGSPVVADRDGSSPAHSRGARRDRIVAGHIAADRPPARGGAPSPPPLPVANAVESRPETIPLPPTSPAAVAAAPVPGQGEIPPGGSSAETIVAFLDAQMRSGWEAAEIGPSPLADDAEWIRRVYLDVAGHIPPAEEVERFLADASSDKRTRLVERLLDQPAYARHSSTVWTNLLVGRTQGRTADREGLERFLRQGFARNRPWSELVAEMVSAEGGPEENGAAGFLLAHLNNEAVPATAVTARVFLGTQVQCTQCHDHPFNDWQQNHFWDLNSFFQQTAAIDVPGTHRLVTKPIEGPLYYENRQGLMRVAYPRFDGERVDSGPETNRRAELARLIVAGDKPQIAEAFVNRVWAQFFGYGFTNPVDDMGPHNPPTHPAVLDRLSREFVASGFDVKRLIRWITASRAYQATSRMNESNSADDPARGEPPLFSRMYVRPMSPEQLYDSLLIATQPRVAGGPDWREAHLRRREWLAQFIHPHGTEENDEATSFAGTVPQALMLMNGALTAGAVSAERGTFLSEVLAEPISETEKIRKLSLAALSRHPAPGELAAIRRLLRHDAREGDRRAPAPAKNYEDLFWALLNSSEFVHVH
ncbi:MAG: DUF1549 and DUF1553 domain-containing protein [Planctomycetaceae bacterium]